MKLFILFLIGILQFCSEIQGEPNSLPLPRFVSLRSNAINLHVGPGKNYPIEWKYIRQGLPIEIIAEFDTWRRIRDCQGTEGWVHKSLLSGRRTVCILDKIRPLRNKPSEKSQIIAHLEPGVIGKALECEGNWCKIEVKSPMGTYKGWLKRRCIWGVYPNETKFQ